MIRGRVLLVARDSALRQMVEDHLRHLGFEIETSDESQEALERAALGRFDVVVASMELGGLTPSRFVDALGAIRPAVGLVVLGELPAVSYGGALEQLRPPFLRSDVGDAVVRAVRHRQEEASARMAHRRRDDEGGGRKRRGSKGGGGSRIGRYEVLERLGVGPSGTVYRCRDSSSAREAAVKVIRRELVERTGRGGLRWLDRFRRAAGTAASVGHPGLVQLEDYGLDEDGGFAYLASELVEGASVAARLEKGERLPPALAVRVVFGAADALAAVHAARLVHRRISPTNVAIDARVGAKVTDLAIASSLDWDLIPLAERPDRAAYAAPEQLTFRPVDARCDQFALGVVLYEALTGGPCFGDGPLRARTRAVLTEEPRPLTEAGVEIPQSLETAFRTMTAKSPADRFQTDDELLEALKGCGDDLGVTLERAAGSSGLI